MDTKEVGAKATEIVPGAKAAAKEKGRKRRSNQKEANG